MTTRVENSPPPAPASFSGPATTATGDTAPPPAKGMAARAAVVKNRSTRKALILAVLAVLFGGAVAFGGGQVLTRHTLVLAVARAVQAGAPITADDLRTASVTADPNLSPIPASQQAQVVGLIAQVPLSAGELLTRAQIGTGSGFSPGQMLVPLALKAGQLPARALLPGQTVLAVSTPGTAPGQGSAGSDPVPITATVVDVGALNTSTQITVIDVRVAPADGVHLLSLASGGTVALILLPAGR